MIKHLILLSAVALATLPALTLGRSQCTHCFGESSGPCQHPDTSCYSKVGDACPAGTEECTCPVCHTGDGNPCHIIIDPSTCVPYENPAILECPNNAFECGAPGVIVSPSPSPSLGASSTPTATPAPSVNPMPVCGACAGLTEGPCQSTNGACFAYIEHTLTCPTGAFPCVCPACPSGTSGPCKHPDTLECEPYADAANQLCNVGSFECFSFAHGPTPIPPSSPSSSPEPLPACQACLGTSSGACVDHVGVCFPFLGDGNCPASTRPCVCPTCTSGAGNPCHAADGSCVAYSDAANLECPAETFECFAPSVYLSATPSPSIGASATRTPSPSPSFEPNPQCSPCVGESEGPCQSEWGVCFSTQETGFCPPGSKECSCADCTSGSGPCHSADNFLQCSEYLDAENRVCPTLTFECGVGVRENFNPVQATASPEAAPMCFACFGTSSGPCQAVDGVCSEFVTPGFCAPSTRQCRCPTCTSGSGDCLFSDGTCANTFTDSNGNARCPSGSFACGAPTEFLPTPSPGTATPSSTPFPMHGVTPECRPCVGTSRGACQAYNGVCWELHEDLDYCPAGTDKCDCPVCNVGSGPCHSTDGARRCADFVNAEHHECPASYFECGAPMAGPSPSPAPPAPVCAPCFGASEGDCQGTDNVCYNKMGGQCPPGSRECECPTCTSGSGDCHRLDGACFAWSDPIDRICPSGTFACGEASVRLSPTPSPSVGALPTTTPTAAPSSRPIPYCLPCAPLTFGPCQDISGVCWAPTSAGSSCPPHTSMCECQPCSSGSGPCRSNILDGSCQEFLDAAKRICPVGSFECGFAPASPTPSPEPSLGPAPMCTPCFGESSGPCLGPGSTCFDKISGQCPAGTRECVCPACSNANLPCHRSDGFCFDFADSFNFVCPAGTFECGAPSVVTSPSPSPSVGAPPSSTPTASPSYDPHPRCRACVPVSEGPCQSAFDVCSPYSYGTTCATGTKACSCDPCTSGSGPCHTVGNYEHCVDYEDAAEALCPAGTFECGGYDQGALVGPVASPEPVGPPPTCQPCFSTSSGPCQIEGVGTCFDSLEDESCPTGTRACICPTCTSGSGSCYRGDGACVDTDAFGVCPHGTWQCGAPSFVIHPSPSPSPGSPPSSTPSPSPSFDPNPVCRPCFGSSSGFCQQDNGVCHGLGEVTECAPGTRQCTCPTCNAGTSGPCNDQATGDCLGYADVDKRICPSGSFECGEPTIRIEAPTGVATCQPCFAWTSGPCQRGDGICFDLLSDGTCPPPSNLCECPACSSGSGPCHSQDGSCKDYVAGTSTCPAFSFECGVGGATVASPTTEEQRIQSEAQVATECSMCVVGTSGPCQSANGVCYGYYPGTFLCPAGSVKCSSTSLDRTVPADPRCSNCHPSGPNSGVCQGEDKICWKQFPGTTLCPTGTSMCAGAEVGGNLIVEVVSVSTDGQGTVVHDSDGEEYVVSSTAEGTECIEVRIETAPCAGNAVSDSSACLPVVVYISSSGSCDSRRLTMARSRALQSNEVDVSIAVPSRLVEVLPAAYDMKLVPTVDSSGRRLAGDGACESVFHRETETLYARCGEGEYVLAIEEAEIDPAVEAVIPVIEAGAGSSRDSVAAPSPAASSDGETGAQQDGVKGEEEEKDDKHMSGTVVAVVAFVICFVGFAGAFVVRRQMMASRNNNGVKKTQILPSTASASGSSGASEENDEEDVRAPSPTAPTAVEVV